MVYLHRDFTWLVIPVFSIKQHTLEIPSNINTKDGLIIYLVLDILMLLSRIFDVMILCTLSLIKRIIAVRKLYASKDNISIWPTITAANAGSIVWHAEILKNVWAVIQPIDIFLLISAASYMTFTTNQTLQYQITAALPARLASMQQPVFHALP